MPGSRSVRQTATRFDRSQQSKSNRKDNRKGLRGGGVGGGGGGEETDRDRGRLQRQTNRDTGRDFFLVEASPKRLERKLGRKSMRTIKQLVATGGVRVDGRQWCRDCLTTCR